MIRVRLAAQGQARPKASTVYQTWGDIPATR